MTYTARTIVTVLSLTLLCAYVLPLCGCAEDAPSAESNPSQQNTVESMVPPTIPARGYFKGFSSLLPPDGDFEAAYSHAAVSGADFANTWVGAHDSGYWNLAEDLGGWWGDQFVDGLTRGNGMFPVINLSFIDRDTAGSLKLRQPPDADYSGLNDDSFRRAYREAAVAAVRAVRPAYISLGNEVNRWYEQYGDTPGDPNNFRHFVTLYNGTYDMVKAVSPETKVFCIFAREIVSENREADMSVLQMFDASRLDVAAFTSYPFAVQAINTPSDMSDDYYSEVIERAGLTDKPFGFTELGWSTLDAFGGEEGQAAFLSDAAGRLTLGQSLDLHLFGWWSLYDLEGDPHETGLVDRDGREKPAYEVWEAL